MKPILDTEFIDKIAPFPNFWVVQITFEWDGETVKSHTIWKKIGALWIEIGGDFNSRFIILQQPDHIHLEQSYRALTCSRLCLEQLEPKLPAEMILQIILMSQITKRQFVFKRI